MNLIAYELLNSSSDVTYDSFF